MLAAVERVMEVLAQAAVARARVVEAMAQGELAQVAALRVRAAGVGLVSALAALALEAEALAWG